VKISELSERTGVSIATLKFYLREGLLRPGALKAPNQADYGETHVRRARLVRTLREVAHLSIAQIAAITGALDRGEDLYDVMGATVDSLGERPAGAPTPEQREAAPEVDRLLGALGLPVRDGSLARDQLIASFAAIREMLFPGFPVEGLAPYARAAAEVVATEVAATPGIFRVEPELALERSVLGLTLFEPVILAFRRLNHEKLVAGRLEGANGPGAQALINPPAPR
jgi:DNA-binding transcriptional MerR regulator